MLFQIIIKYYASIVEIIIHISLIMVYTYKLMSFSERPRSNLHRRQQLQSLKSVLLQRSWLNQKKTKVHVLVQGFPCMETLESHGNTFSQPLGILDFNEKWQKSWKSHGFDKIIYFLLSQPKLTVTDKIL